MHIILQWVYKSKLKYYLFVENCKKFIIYNNIKHYINEYNNK